MFSENRKQVKLTFVVIALLLISLLMPPGFAAADVTEVTVGKQQGSLTAGSPGEVSFSVTTNDNSANLSRNLSGLLTGASFNLDYSGSAGTLTISVPGSAAAGRYPLRLTIDDVTSNEFILIIDQRTFRLTVSGEEGGTVDSAKSGRYAEDDRIVVTAQPSPGYMFYMWTTSNGGYFFNERGNSTNFVMPAGDTTVVAHFFAVFNLEIGISDGGAVNVLTGIYKEGERVTLQAVSYEGFVFEGWRSSGGGTFENPASTKTTFVMPAANVVISGVFRSTTPENPASSVEDDEDRQLYSISTSVDEGGRVSLTKRQAHEGETISLIAIPSDGFDFGRWQGTDGVVFADADAASTTFIMPAMDVTITAVFTETGIQPTASPPAISEDSEHEKNSSGMLVIIAVSLAAILAFLLFILYKRGKKLSGEDADSYDFSYQEIPDKDEDDLQAASFSFFEDSPGGDVDDADDISSGESGFEMNEAGFFGGSLSEKDRSEDIPEDTAVEGFIEDSVQSEDFADFSDTGDDSNEPEPDVSFFNGNASDENMGEDIPEDTAVEGFIEDSIQSEDFADFSDTGDDSYEPEPDVSFFGGSLADEDMVEASREEVIDDAHEEGFDAENPSELSQPPAYVQSSEPAADSVDSDASAPLSDLASFDDLLTYCKQISVNDPEKRG